MDDERRDCVFAAADASKGVDCIEALLGGGEVVAAVVVERSGAVEEEGEGVRLLEKGKNELGAGVISAEPAQVGRFRGPGGVGMVACDLYMQVLVNRSFGGEKKRRGRHRTDGFRKERRADLGDGHGARRVLYA